jgi:hypothetical protein
MEEEVEKPDEIEQDSSQPLPIQIINNQIQILISVYDLDDSLYEALMEDKIKVMSKAFKVILKAQNALEKMLKPSNLSDNS